MKQATAYALTHRTQYVAIFDWDFLVLIVYRGLDSTQSAEDLYVQEAGDYCEIAIMDNRTSQSANVRAALLGFLITAYRNTH
ncbi:hypothetical protein F5Y03DRAFT_365968 [Xylaria venustula]|nr:hypothetical protein F5Y03DRAFT_365968 [Xylaria venustula]